MEIIAVDPTDDAGFRAWHDVIVRAQGYRRPWSNPWQREEVRAELLEQRRRRSLSAWAGLAGGDVVCAGFVSLPQLDNLNSADLEVNTDPAHRRRGYGSQMLVHLERLAAADGRSLFNAEVPYPATAPPDGAGEPDVDFATRRGYAFGLSDAHRRLVLPVDPALLEELAAQAAPAHTDYRIEAFSGAVPEELLGSFAEIDASLMTEAPTGAVERAPAAVDLAAFRDDEALVAAQGRTPYHAVALDAAGRVVAYTTVAATRHAPDRCFQWGTLVRSEHRGHRLGLAVKVANLRSIQAAQPGLSQLFTYNAEMNAHMHAINDRLGFETVERLGEFQKRLNPADAD